MDTSSILGRKNYSRETFKAIERGRKKEAQKRAGSVVSAVTSAEEELRIAKQRLKNAKKRVKHINKVLKKYKKTGDQSVLNSL